VVAAVLFVSSWLATAGYLVLCLLVCLGAFAQVMFFTVLERKFLALMQRRTGPRVVGVRGRLQCIADAVKLLTKVFAGPRLVSSAAFQGAALAGFWLSWLNFGNVVYAPGLDVAEVEYSVFYATSLSVAFSIM
jgi:NADH-quinone oxidoreductase subunit H